MHPWRILTDELP